MSTIKLYSSTNTSAGAWKLIPGKLFKIDSFPDYLAQFTPYIVSKVQYIKHGLELYVKLDLSQTKAQPNDTIGYKYMSIQNTNEGVVYYYVDKATWRSANCVEFHLIMDVLNTYQDGSDYVFKANTRIIREHKDRFTFTKKISCQIDYSQTGGAGTIAEGYRVSLLNDRGEVVFTGIVSYINVDTITIDIENPTHEEDYIEMIEPYLGLTFEIQVVNAVGNYILFEPASMQDFTFNTTYNHYRKIDYVSENINPLLLRGSTMSSIEDSSIFNQNWYLLYRNQNDPSDSLVNPVDCYLIPENETKTDAGVITGGRLVPSFLDDSHILFFEIASGKSATLSNGVVAQVEPQYRVRIAVQKAGNKMSVVCYAYNTIYDTMYVWWQYEEIDYITFEALPMAYNIYDIPKQFSATIVGGTIFTESFTDSGDTNNIDPISLLDRTDAKNIKLIKLPYIPYGFTYTNDVLEVDGNDYWERASFTQSGGGGFYALHLRKSSTKLERSIYASSSQNPFSKLRVSIIDPRETDLRDTNEVDSKLYHSEFYAPTFVYDSFSTRVELEKCDLDYYITNGTSGNIIKFLMTKTINSKFMFTLTSYVCDKANENFYNVLTIARNNEEVLYNVPYINYIRNGYQYDVKNKNLSAVANWTGVGLSVISIGASLLAPSVPLKVAGVVGSLVSMASAIKGAVSTTIQNEQTLQQKITQLQNQTASVSGSDDVDLMSEYCDNRLKYTLYEPTANMKHLLDELFFYAGYNSGRMGIPNHNTRCNFDYLECDAVLESAGANIPQEIINEIKNCYKTGVSFIHKTSRTTNKWDIEQKYENWENTILEG